jgi:membrane carboxypeptidase/penicillin-binding protein
MYAATLRRNQEMKAAGIVSQQALDDANRDYLSNVNKQNTAIATVVVDRAKLQQAQAQVAESQASLKQLEEQLSYTTIVSPIDGVVLSRDVEVGDAVSSILVLGSTATLVFTLGDTSQVYVDGKVDEADIGSVYMGQPARIRIESFKNRVFYGKVTRIAPLGVEKDNVTTFAVRVSIDNPTGEIKAMVGGYSFDESKFNRATQAQRQVGSSFKIYVYSAAVEQGFTPFDTILDAPFTTMSGGQAYSPHNYDEKFEGVITLRRALDGSRNVPAVKLAEKVGMNSVIDMARRFGITSPLPPYLPITLGAADLNLLEHTSAFTVFPDDGIRIDPHMIRRVTTYDGALLEQAHPLVHDVVEPDVARTMTAMLQDVIERGTGTPARALGRPAGGKTGTTNDFTDAWFIGFTPEITAGVWVGYDDKSVSLGKPETGAIAALPIWLEFMQGALDGKPVQAFQNVVPLEKVALTKNVKVDTPDTAPTEAGEGPTRLEPNPQSSPTAPGIIPAGEAPAKAVPPPQNPPAAPSPRS